MSARKRATRITKAERLGFEREAWCRRLMRAADATYAQHEYSTSDSYLKRRLLNAVNQVVVRSINDAYPESKGWPSMQLEEWRTSLGDIAEVLLSTGSK